MMLQDIAPIFLITCRVLHHKCYYYIVFILDTTRITFYKWVSSCMNTHISTVLSTGFVKTCNGDDVFIAGLQLHCIV